jgi:hypothetical protein
MTLGTKTDSGLPAPDYGSNNSETPDLENKNGTASQPLSMGGIFGIVFGIIVIVIGVVVTICLFKYKFIPTPSDCTKSSPSSSSSKVAAPSGKISRLQKYRTGYIIYDTGIGIEKYCTVDKNEADNDDHILIVEYGSEATTFYCWSGVSWLQVFKAIAPDKHLYISSPSEDSTKVTVQVASEEAF